MRFYLYLPVFFAVCFFAVPYLAAAQSPAKGDKILDFFEGDAPTNVNPPPKEQEAPKSTFKPKKDVTEIPTEYIDEALAFRDKCEMRADMKKHYNCECLSVKYLDQRVARGASANESSIMLSIESECKDGTFVAGSMYNQCMAGRVRYPGKRPLDEFCECFGREYAKLYELSGLSASGKAHVAIRTRAVTGCFDPNLSRQLYSYAPNEN